MNSNTTTNTPDAGIPDPATDAATPHQPDATAEIDTSAPSNDNAVLSGVRDTTELLAHPEVEQAIRTRLRRYGVRSQDLPDAIAEVQTKSLEVARTGEMPPTIAKWQALSTTIGVRWALDQLRQQKRRKKYDAGLCEDPDVYIRPTLHWEHRDPVDTKRYLAILKELFDSGEMPEDGQEILQAEADEVPREEIAAELGLTENAVTLRLFRMRKKFRARLAALGMLVLMVILFAIMSPVGDVAAPAPAPVPEQPAPRASSVPASDDAAPRASENRPLR